MNQVDSVSHQLMIFAGITMYIFGSIGNLLNICVFAIWSRSKKNSNKYSRSHQTCNSSLYLLVSSIANLLVIIYPLFTRIMLDGYNYQITKDKIFIRCKLRYYILHTCDLISLTCICLATFDRYLISSREVRLRKLSTTRRRTKLIILFLIVLLSLHSLPILKYYTVTEEGFCTIVSVAYLYYYLYIFQIFLHGLLPITFLSIFGILTFKQLRILNKRKLHSKTIKSERQLSRMLLLISLTIILSSIPYCIEQSYLVLIKGKNRQLTSFFYLYHVTCSLLFYTNPVMSFYIYYISTRNVRLQIRKIFCCEQNNQYVIIYKVKPITPTSDIFRRPIFSN
ncbi:unnamed protein product [Adineta ricciae]|uniref:G-protein coupled receptors family 1 profile domain-containing protein n=1 Tax=Adineta ricciae TaxID=249248 RepID=A0A815I5Q7_ADIRI|nr:unnamed protein product [Adineta ricciae]CAF1516734.1 unnamed protein product [Adineta ricciae]